MFEKLRANAFLDVFLRHKLIHMQILQFRYENKNQLLTLNFSQNFPVESLIF